jgi:hypothetical protein
LPGPSANKKIILRLSRTNGSGSPPKTDDIVPVLAAESAAPNTEQAPQKPYGDEAPPAMMVDSPPTNGHARSSIELELSANLASIDEETQMRAIVSHCVSPAILTTVRGR